MKKYYAQIDDVQRGPFDIEELARAGVRPSTYIWCKGMDDWQRADEVQEVRDAFRRHLSDKQPGPSPQAAQQDGDDNLSEVPQRYRYFVRKSGTPVAPPNSMEPDTSVPPQVSMTLAVLSLVLCFVPTGIVAVIFTYKAQKTWAESTNPKGDTSEEEMRKKAHEYARLAKMWLGLSVALGLIFWTLTFSIKS